MADIFVIELINSWVLKIADAAKIYNSVQPQNVL